MDNRIILYIDILGFSDIVNEDKGRIVKHVIDIFNAMDESPAFEHDIFSVLQFSDTLIIYSKNAPCSDDEQQYMVGYLCEFAQHLQYKLLSRNVFFRAVLTKGDFYDVAPGDSVHTFKNIRAFWGSALVDAAEKEKSIKAIGLFIDNKKNNHRNLV
ncbi:hypothetical protein [Glycocaulis alkaliphilus]|uniref:hypothetical protein n=1 Tax=Glycocaulis alkaliphilus TaxID=1434191 RepID=UPI000FD7C113|nr:hypothetical protein [Glycocaulis alkaliphilus]GGB72281.1 hypothetical protein GCM10007417_10150 [Glycocaulis alkaliphilus]